MGQHNEIRVAGGVGGNVVADNRNTGGPAPRIGFVVAVVGFGHRNTEEKGGLRRRLDELVRLVLADLGAGPGDTPLGGAGDSLLRFLPAGADPSRVLPAMMSATAERLGRDNRCYRDRMRLRMAIGAGPVGTGPPGFTGQLVVDLRRLVDCAELRRAVRDHPDTDLAVLVSQALYDDVVRSGQLDPAEFTGVAVTAKGFAATAWLRIW